MSTSLTHLDADGHARMVDVGDKAVSHRSATATGEIHLTAATLALIQQEKIAKGNVITVATIAGIQAAKRTSELIPLCHQLPLSSVKVHFEFLPHGLRATATAKTTAQTGVEMEALTAVSVALLTIYDMVKAVDKSLRLSDIVLLEKTKTPTDA